MNNNAIQIPILLARLTILTSWIYGASYISKLSLPLFVAAILFVLIIAAAFRLFIKLGEIENLALNAEYSNRQAKLWQTRYIDLAKSIEEQKQS